jgi:hypothetical protein
MNLAKTILMVLALTVSFISGGARSLLGSVANATENDTSTEKNAVYNADEETAENFAKLYPNAAKILIEKSTQAQPDAIEMEHMGGSCD